MLSRSERVRIPTDVVAAAISASYRNGVLEVHLPVVDDERGEAGHRIDVDRVDQDSRFFGRELPTE